MDTLGNDKRLDGAAVRTILEAHTALAHLVACGWEPTPEALAAKEAVDAAWDALTTAHHPSVVTCPGCRFYGWVHSPVCRVGEALRGLRAAPVLATTAAQALFAPLTPEDGCYLVRLPLTTQRFVPREETSLIVPREALRYIPRDALVWLLPVAALGAVAAAMGCDDRALQETLVSRYRPLGWPRSAFSGGQ